MRPNVVHPPVHDDRGGAKGRDLRRWGGSDNVKPRVRTLALHQRQHVAGEIERRVGIGRVAHSSGEQQRAPFRRTRRGREIRRVDAIGDDVHRRSAPSRTRAAAASSSDTARQAAHRLTARRSNASVRSASRLAAATIGRRGTIEGSACHARCGHQTDPAHRARRPVASGKKRARGVPRAARDRAAAAISLASVSSMRDRVHHARKPGVRIVEGQTLIRAPRRLDVRPRSSRDRLATTPKARSRAERG